MSTTTNNNQMIFAGTTSRFEGLLTENSNFVDFQLQKNIIPLLLNNKNNLKKIISGGAYKHVYNCFWIKDKNNFENKIYIFHCNPEYNLLFSEKLKYVRKIDKNKYQVNFKQFILDNYFNNLSNNLNNNLNIDFEMKDIIGNSNGIFFWLKNKNLFYLEFEKDEIKQIKSLQQSKIITTFGTGNMSSRYMFKDDGGNCYFWNDTNLVEIKKSELNNSEPKLFGCCYDDNNIIVTMENKLYCKKYNDEPFQYKKSNFENESNVIDLKCGYGHTVILLENQSIYAFGFNSIHQCGVFEHDREVHEPTKLTTISLNSTILSIQCTSRGTCIVCKDEIIFIGELVENEVNCLKRISTTINDHEDNNDKKDYNNYGKEFNYFNSVACGPWHYIIYRNCDELFTKSLEYFMSNMKSKFLKFIDINIVITANDE
ncbi:hypothetical protein ABK040_007064 [Willaertia magna]